MKAIGIVSVALALAAAALVGCAGTSSTSDWTTLLDGTRGARCRSRRSSARLRALNSHFDRMLAAVVDERNRAIVLFHAVDRDPCIGACTARL